MNVGRYPVPMNKARLSILLWRLFGIDVFGPQVVTCGIHTCRRFGQQPRLGLWLHNLVFHHGK